MLVRIAIIEDQEPTRIMWRGALEGSPGYACVAEFGSAEDAQEQFREGAWDVAIVDVKLPGRSGLSLIRWLKERQPEMRCLVITAVNDSRTLFEAFRAGADGYLLKRGEPKHLLTRLGEILAGEIPLSPGVARRVLHFFRDPQVDPRLEQLTQTQRRVLLALAEGSSNKELSQLLSMSEPTVRSHLAEIFKKLRIHSRAEAVAFVHRLGIGAKEPSEHD